MKITPTNYNAIPRNNNSKKQNVHFGTNFKISSHLDEILGYVPQLAISRPDSVLCEVVDKTGRGYMQGTVTLTHPNGEKLDLGLVGHDELLPVLKRILMLPESDAKTYENFVLALINKSTSEAREALADVRRILNPNTTTLKNDTW